MGAIGTGFDINRGLPWLARRGPDGQNIWSSPDRRVSVLHCRLAIVDTDPRADQPFRDSQRNTIVALNGEIYNYRTLRRDLSYPFRSESDTEVIAAIYATEGVNGFRRLEGMFAFTLIDENARRVYLVRDAVGKKPLFVFRRNNGVVFGSSVLPLVASTGGEATLEPETAQFYWRRAYVSPDRSAIAGVYPVQPGDVVTLDWDGVEIERSRCETAPDRVYAGEDDKMVARNVGELIARAIDHRLENNNEPVALLSGGIDSTVIAKIASERMRENGRKKPLKVLTLGQLVPNTKDEYYARYSAKRLGLAVQIIRPPRARLADSILRALSLQDEPLGMPSYFFLHQMVEAAAQHGRVLLTGDGGDEVFLGYQPPPEWCSRTVEMGVPPPFVKVGPGPNPWMGSWARDVSGNTLLGHMFSKADRASAEQGVEMRCPLLDWTLFSYVRSLPYNKVAGNGTLKPLLKAQLAGWPNWFLERPKLGFAFNLRWRWALSSFEGLREAIAPESIETFVQVLPEALRAPARNWTTPAIVAHFSSAWKLLVWSTFLSRFAHAVQYGKMAPGIRKYVAASA